MFLPVFIFFIGFTLSTVFHLTCGKKIKKGAKKLGYSLTRNSEAMAKHFNFANEDTEPANGKTAKSVTIPFSNYSTCKMKYSAKSRNK